MDASGVDIHFSDTINAKDEAIRGFRSIKWDEYVSLGMFNVTEMDVALFKEVENDTDGAIIENLVQTNVLKPFAQALMRVLESVSNNETVIKWALTRLEDVLKDDTRTRVQLLKDCAGNINCMCLKRNIGESDHYTKAVAAKCYAHILSTWPSVSDSDWLVDWILGMLSNPPLTTPGATPPRGIEMTMKCAVKALMVLLRQEVARRVFSKKRGTEILAKLVKNTQLNSADAQLLYELCFCMWILTFDTHILADFVETQAINALCDQVGKATREKVVRVCMASLANLVGKFDGKVNSIMIESGLYKSLSKLTERQWSDEDVKADIDAVYKQLQKDYKELSTYERYEREIDSGKLEWGIVHTEKFWREHVFEMEKTDFKVINKLTNLLDSEDPMVVAVACYDLGEFVRFYPQGRLIVKNMNAKPKIMTLMSNENSEVQKHALLSISKMMVTNWEYIR